jgi:type IV secretion system protein VirD4
MQAELNAILGLVVVGLVLWWRFWKPRPHIDRTAHGTAGWQQDLDSLAQPGLVLGRDRDGRLLSLPRAIPHHLFVAPTGAGKGVGYIVPWLLTHKGSVLVIDPKGENYQLTAHVRRRYGKVLRLDPFKVTGGTDRWNPFDEIPDGEEGISEARALAESMVLRPPDGDHDPHWNNRASQLLTALIALVTRVCEGGERSLSGVRDLLCGGVDGALAALGNQGGLYARMAAGLAAMNDKEKAGVISTADAHTTWADCPEMAHATGGSTFRLDELLGGTPTTLYLVLPPHHLNEANGRWLRCVVGCLLRLLSKKGGAHELLMVLDEAATLGFMPELAMAVSLLRSFKLRMMFFLQSFGQVEELFRTRKSVLTDNTGLVTFGLNDLESMNRISQMLGNYTHAVANPSANWGTSRNSDDRGHNGVGASGGDSVSISTHLRALLTPDEVSTLHQSFAFV